MPCRDDYGECESRARDQAEQVKIKQRLDKVTRLLCEVLTAGVPHASDELVEWWQKHQAADKKRIAAEEKAKQEEKRQLLDRAEKLKNELAKITKRLDEHK